MTREIERESLTQKSIYLLTWVVEWDFTAFGLNVNVLAVLCHNKKIQIELILTVLS